MIKRSTSLARFRRFFDNNRSSIMPHCCDQLVKQGLDFRNTVVTICAAATFPVKSRFLWLILAFDLLKLLADTFGPPSLTADTDQLLGHDCRRRANVCKHASHLALFALPAAPGSLADLSPLPL